MRDEHVETDSVPQASGWSWIAVLALAITLPVSGYAQGYASVAERLDALAASWSERTTPRFETELVSPAAAVASLQRADAASVCAWVRDTIAFEPYRGARRGARGTLFAGAGNSWDHALLTGAMLDEIGVAWRLRRGGLPDALALALLDRYTGELSIHGVVGADRRRELADIAEHVWLEVETAGEWSACDPTVPGIAFGTSVGEGRAVAEADVALGTIDIVVVAESGGRVVRSASLSVPWEQGTYRHLDVRVVRQADAWVPVIVAGEERSEGQAIGDPGASVRVEIAALQQGRATRHAFWVAGPEAPNGAARATLPSAGFQGSFFVLPGWVTTNYADAVESTGQSRVDWAPVLSAMRTGESAWSRAEREAAMEQLGTVSSLRLARWAAAADAAVWGDGMLLGAAPTVRDARIVGALTQVDATGGAWNLLTPMAAVEALAALGSPTAASEALAALGGLRWSEAAAASLGATSTPDATLRRASGEGATLVTAHPGTVDRLARLPFGASVQARISASVNERGELALLPNRVAAGDPARWYAIAPSTGATTPDGEGGAVATWAWDATNEAESVAEAFEHIASLPQGSAQSACVAMCSLASYRNAICSDERERDVPSVSDCTEVAPGVGAALFAATGCSALARPLQCGGAWTEARVVSGRGTVASPPWSPAGMVVPANSSSCDCD